MTSSQGTVHVAKPKIEAIFRSSPYAFKRQADGSLLANLTSKVTRLDYILYCSEEKDGCVYAKLMTPVVERVMTEVDKFCARINLVWSEGSPHLSFEHEKKCFSLELEVNIKPRKFKKAVNFLVQGCDILVGIVGVTVSSEGSWDPFLVDLAATPVGTKH